MKVSELLTGPETWVRRRLAVDSKDREVDPFDTTAVKWCLLGAIFFCYGCGPSAATVIRRVVAEYDRRGIEDCLNQLWEDGHSEEYLIAFRARLETELAQDWTKPITLIRAYFWVRHWNDHGTIEQIMQLARDLDI